MSEPEARLSRWLAGYSLPAADHPLAHVEAAHLQVLKAFLALLLVTHPHQEPQDALSQLLPEGPPLPLQGPPSEVLIRLGLSRPRGPLIDLQNRLQSRLDAEQAALYLRLVE